jgi:hypothetical protein
MGSVSMSTTPDIDPNRTVALTTRKVLSPEVRGDFSPSRDSVVAVLTMKKGAWPNTAARFQ